MTVRVVLVNQYFPPDTSATSHLASGLRSALLEMGAEVTVVSGAPSYRPSETLSFRWWQLTRSSQGAIRVRSTRFSRDRMYGRIANYLSYLALMFPVVALQRADVYVVMTDPPLALLAVMPIARLRRIPVVYWLQDYHPEFLVGVGAVRRNLIVRLWSWLHHRCMARAREVVVLGRDMHARVANAGVDLSRIHIVPNGGAVGALPRSRPSPRASGGDFVVLHAGEIGLRGAWNTVAEAARMGVGRFRFVLLGDGVEAPGLKAATADLPNVSIEPPVPQAEVANWLASADALLVMVREGTEGYSVPSKTYELLAAGRPLVVMAVPNAEPALLVNELGCGVVTPPSDAAALVETIEFLASNTTLRAEMSERAVEAAPLFDRRTSLSAVAKLVLSTDESKIPHSNPPLNS